MGDCPLTSNGYCTVLGVCGAGCGCVWGVGGAERVRDSKKIPRIPRREHSPTIIATTSGKYLIVI